jgi:hypothetical protein
MWSLNADANYYNAKRAEFPVDYSVLPAYITAAASNKGYAAMVDEYAHSVGNSSNWILLQEINIEGSSFFALLLYVPRQETMWHAVTFGIVGGTPFRRESQLLESPRFLFALSQRPQPRENIDFSASKTMDGTAAFVTTFAKGVLSRAAVYEPQTLKQGDHAASSAYQSLSRLVEQIRSAVSVPHQ